MDTNFVISSMVLLKLLWRNNQIQRTQADYNILDYTYYVLLMTVNANDP